ncbi:MAG: hypothetical protein JSS83_01845 [Cyanobacteria bacterium SZAS LIN-3]|nr:hypothetical protein [Cyanobacteria bacterium SZAS LIN-3]
MTALFTGEEIIDLTGARMACGMMPDEAGPIAVDTREPMEGAWFVALGGSTYDGHDFLGDAFSAGALGCIVADRPNYPIASTSFPLLAVDDTEEALGILARNWRRRTLKKLCLVAATESGQPGSGWSKATLDLGAHFAQLRGHEHLSESFLDWRTRVSIILAQFLNLTEEQDFLLAEFAPQPLTRAPWLVRQLLPNLMIFPEEAFDFARLALGAKEAHQVKVDMAKELNGLNKPGLPAQYLVAAADAELAGELGLEPTLDLLDPSLSQQMGLKP